MASVGESREHDGRVGPLHESGGWSVFACDDGVEFKKKGFGLLYFVLDVCLEREGVIKFDSQIFDLGCFFDSLSVQYDRWYICFVGEADVATFVLAKFE